jgi:hypothetical protein
VRYWQNGTVVQSRHLSRRTAVLIIGVLSVLTSCTSDQNSSCNSDISISDYVSTFSQGLDNFSEDRYAQLRTDSNAAYERAVNAVTEESVSTEASIVANKISTFVLVMDKIDWDVNRALDIGEAVTAASDLGSELTLRLSNAVEGQLISKCGMPSTQPPPSDSEITLPMAPIQSPTATDPIVNPLNDSSEMTVIGKMIATQFGLTITDGEATCLGMSLSDIYDVSSSDTDNAQYQRQFQRAFDNCGIEYTISSQ